MCTRVRFNYEVARNTYVTTRKTKGTPNEEIMFFKVTKFLTSQNLSLEGLNCTSGCAWTNGRHQIYIYIYLYMISRDLIHTCICKNRCPSGLPGLSHITAYSKVIVPMDFPAVALCKSYRLLTIFGYYG